jgi:multicomponent K+:H+ antiporter subunit G
MSDTDALPFLLEALIALLVVLGALLAMLGSLGLLRLKTFYERVHPPTMGITLGLGLILVASMLLFSVLESRPVLHEILIAVFAVVTTPVTYMVLLRAAIQRGDSRPSGVDEEHGSAATRRGRADP